MAEQVTGQIGQDNVVLNNAASETTLLKLLEAMKAMGGSGAASKTANLAGAAGVDPATVAKANDSVRNFTGGMSDAEKALRNEIAADENLIGVIEKVNNAFASATSKLVAGTYKSQDLYSSLGLLPGPIGIVANAFSILAGYQQQNLETQQSLAKSGAAFGGALTEVRAAAANSFLTLGEFSAAVAKNQAILSSMGGSMEAGVKKFVALQNELLAPGSPTQQNLASLGYSASDAADLTASYMRAQGTMNKEALKDNKAVSASIGEYAQQLDMMAQLTGKSRAELQAKMDKENTEAQWQSALANMSKEKADKLRQGMQMAMTQGGQGAVDAFKAMALGLPPMTEEGKLYMATQRAGTNALRQYVVTANDASISSKKAGELNRATLAKQIADGANDHKALQKVLQADQFAGGKLSKVFADSTALQTKFNGMTQEQIAAELEKMNVEEERQKSQAADMDAANKNLQELGQAIIGIINPLVALVTPAFKFLGGILASVGKWLNSFGETTKIVISTVGLLVGALTVYFLKQSVQNKMSALSGLGGGGGGGALGGVANKAAGAAGSVGGGIGNAISGVLTGLSEGLKKLGNPQVMLGAVTLGLLAGTLWIASKGLENFAKISWESMAKGFVTLLGLGALAAILSFAAPLIIAGSVAIGIMGVALIPFGYAISLVSKGMADFTASLEGLTGIDGGQLIQLGEGILALSAGLVAFAAASVVGGLASIGSKITNFFSGGGPIAQIKTAVTDLAPVLPQLVLIGPAINSYAAGIVAFGKAVDGVDIAKAEQLKKALGPSAVDSIANAGSQLIKAATGAISGKSGGEEKTATELAQLNKTMQDILRYMKDTADNTKKNIDATRALNGNLFSA